MRNVLSALAAGVLIWGVSFSVANAAEKASAVKRGEYLTKLGGCGDCHTPGYFLGKPDHAKYLAGSDVGFQTPMGTFTGPNLTSDKATGLGNWTKQDIVTALQTGIRPDGRQLSEVMPWRDFAHLTKADAEAIASYLMSLKPITHQVAEPLAAGVKAEFPVMTVIFPQKPAQ